MSDREITIQTACVATGALTAITLMGVGMAIAFDDLNALWACLAIVGGVITMAACTYAGHLLAKRLTRNL